VLGEESDNPDGVSVSHFELYHTAMTAAGADTGPIDDFLRALSDGSGIDVALANCAAPAGSRAFVSKTFEFIDSGKAHIIAAAFILGREEPIPSMFRKLVDSLGSGKLTRYSPLCFISTRISSSTRTTWANGYGDARGRLWR
jgi:hypothetical protein